MTQPAKKIDILRANCANGDYYAALRLAASFPRLAPKHRDAIKGAWSAASNPGFYREIGKDPANLVALGVVALMDEYKPAGDVWPVFEPNNIKDLMG